MKRSETTLFGLDTIDGYLAFCSEAVADFASHQDSVPRGFSAILALNHLPDWLEHKKTRGDITKAGIGFDNDWLNKRADIEAKNPDLKIVREIANGFKHVRLVHSTQRIEGYGAGPYGIGPFDAPYLLIDLGETKAPAERWCVGLDLCQRVLGWWGKILEPILESK
jgi:hypothetical protein